MAFSCTIDLPLSTPTLNLSEVAGGGNFAAGTYTFGIWLNGYSTNSPLVWCSHYVEATITVSANAAIKFTYGSIDANAVKLYIYKVQSSSYRAVDYAGTDTGYGNYSLGVSLASYPTEFTITQNTFAVRTAGLQNYETTSFPFGFRPDKGVGRIKVTSNANFTCADINAALVASGLTEGEDYLDMGEFGICAMCSMDLSYCTNTPTFTISGRLIYCYGGIYNQGACTIYSSAGGAGTTILNTRGGGYKTPLYLSGGLNLNNLASTSVSPTYIKSGITYGDVVGFTYNLASTGSVNKSYFKTTYGGWDLSAIDCMVDAGTVNEKPSTQPTRQRSICSGFQIYFGAGFPTATFTNQEFIITSTYSIFFTCPTSTTYPTKYFLDCVFNRNGTIESIPVCYMYSYSAYDQEATVYVGNTVNIKVEDEQGTAVAGATVILKDKNGNTVFAVTTEASGSITQQNVYFYSIKNVGTAGDADRGIENDTNSVRTNLNPYTITVQKTGYESEIIPITISGKQNLTIALKPARIQTDQEEAIRI